MTASFTIFYFLLSLSLSLPPFQRSIFQKFNFDRKLFDLKINQ